MKFEFNQLSGFGEKDVSICMKGSLVLILNHGLLRFNISCKYDDFSLTFIEN